MRLCRIVSALLVLGSSLFVSGCAVENGPPDSGWSASVEPRAGAESDDFPIGATLAQESSSDSVNAPLLATPSRLTLVELLDQRLDSSWGEGQDPLQDRVARIAVLAGLTITIDANALREAGLTRNMQQSAQAASATVRQALATTLAGNRAPTEAFELCYVIISESPPHVELTTRAAATSTGGTILQLAASPVAGDAATALPSP